MKMVMLIVLCSLIMLGSYVSGSYIHYVMEYEDFNTQNLPKWATFRNGFVESGYYILYSIPINDRDITHPPTDFNIYLAMEGNETSFNMGFKYKNDPSNFYFDIGLFTGENTFVIELRNLGGNYELLIYNDGSVFYEVGVSGTSYGTEVSLSTVGKTLFYTVEYDSGKAYSISGQLNISGVKREIWAGFYSEGEDGYVSVDYISMYEGAVKYTEISLYENYLIFGGFALLSFLIYITEWGWWKLRR